MNVSSKITKTWLSWLGVAFLVIAAIAIIAVIVFPMFGAARARARYSPAVARHMEASMSADAVVPKESATGSSGVAWASSQPRMVISSADVRLEVSNIGKRHQEVGEIARRAGGFVTSSTVEDMDGSRSAHVTVRVPQARYAETLDAICKLGKVLSKQEEGADVTEEYVDLQSRLRNLRREEEAFLKTLGSANRVTDILAVERELSRVRGEIEEATGRTKFLENQVSLATIDVALTEPEPAITTVVTWNIVQTATGAYNGLAVVFRGITSMVIWLAVFIPLWVLLGIVVVGIRRHYRRRSAR